MQSYFIGGPWDLSTRELIGPSPEIRVHVPYYDEWRSEEDMTFVGEKMEVYRLQTVCKPSDTNEAVAIYVMSGTEAF